MHAANVFAHGPVDRLPVAHVGDIDDHLHEMLHAPARLLDELADVLHHLVGLLDRVVALDVLCVIEVLRTLASEPYGTSATRDHRLAEIVVEVLLGIGVPRVERSDARMGHACQLSLPHQSRHDDAHPRRVMKLVLWRARRRIRSPFERTVIHDGRALDGRGQDTMASESVDTLVVGAGQAGVAMSEHLGRHGIEHVVLERHRIAERWRTERWDGLVANGPAWHDRFPGMTYPATDPDAFPPKEAVADYFVAYAEMIGAPIRCGVEVTRVTRRDGAPGFDVETSQGPLTARRIVAATGPFQRPIVPPVIPDTPGLGQMHSTAYRNPDQLPDGAVLVVGAGSSGSQIADELLRAGRRTFLSIGPHDRPFRRYRGRDNVWWLGVLGRWELAAMEPGLEHVTIAVSGAHGGRTVDFREMAARGMTLLGMTQSCEDGVLHFAPDLTANMARGDEYYLALLDQCDAYAERHGLDLPVDPDARRITPDPDCVTDPVLSLDLAKEGIGSIIWATDSRLISVGCRWTRSTAAESRRTRAVCRANRASISSACPGCRGAGRLSFGVSGTTRATLPTRLPSSAITKPMLRREVCLPASLEACRPALNRDRNAPEPRRSR